MDFIVFYKGQFMPLRKVMLVEALIRMAAKS